MEKETHRFDQYVQVALVCEIATVGADVIITLSLNRKDSSTHFPSISGWSYGFDVRRRIVPELDGLSKREPWRCHLHESGRLRSENVDVPL